MARFANSNRHAEHQIAYADRRRQTAQAPVSLRMALANLTFSPTSG